MIPCVNGIWICSFSLTLKVQCPSVWSLRFFKNLEEFSPHLSYSIFQFFGISRSKNKVYFALKWHPLPHFKHVNFSSAPAYWQPAMGQAPCWTLVDKNRPALALLGLPVRSLKAFLHPLEQSKWLCFMWKWICQQAFLFIWHNNAIANVN